MRTGCGTVGLCPSRAVRLAVRPGQKNAESILTARQKSGILDVLTRCQYNFNDRTARFLCGESVALRGVLLWCGREGERYGKESVGGIFFVHGDDGARGESACGGCRREGL